MDKSKRRLTLFNFFSWLAGIGIILGLSDLENVFSQSSSDNPIAFLGGFYIVLYGIPCITLTWYVWMILTIKSNFSDRSYRYWNLAILASPILFYLLFLMIHLSIMNSFSRAMEGNMPLSTDISKSPYPALSGNWLCETSRTNVLPWESIFFESDSLLYYSGITFKYKYKDSTISAISTEDSLQFIFKIKLFTPQKLIIEEQKNPYGNIGKTFPCVVVLKNERDSVK
jgi:hypothetical protein